MAPDRNSALDVARGVAMVLVVAGHSVRGLLAAKIGPTGFLRQVDTFLYLGSLPVFAVVIGLLTPGSVRRAGWRAYLRQRLGLLLYLYLVWTLIQGSVEVLTSRWKNTPVTWADVAAVWVPIGHLWFLPHLAVATVVLVAVAPWRPGFRAWVGSLVVLVVSLAAWGWDPNLAGLGGLGLLGCYLFGAAVGAERFGRLAAGVPTWLLAVVALGGLVSVAVMVQFVTVTTPTTQSDRTPQSVAWGVVGVALLVAGLMSLAVGWARLGSSRWVAYVGRYSLAVYLAHIVVTAGTRIALVRLAVSDPSVHILLATLLGVGLPLALERLTRPVPYLFVPPWTVARRPVPAVR